ncbi:MAG: hypothetical protein KDK70_40145 [Myxococcales bacterium]|nr:hypothetical protein [Myxococcales bacterium]
MSHFVTLGRVGAHVLDQLELVLALAEDPGSGVGRGVWLRTVEVAIPFASSDGSDVSPATVVVGETPITIPAARELLLALDRRVLVSAADVEAAPDAARGTLTLRVSLSCPASPEAPSNDSNPST